MTATTYFEISGPDTGRLRAFYGDALGLPVGDPDPSGYAMVPHGPARIAHVTDPAGNRVGLFSWAAQPAG